MTSLTLVQLYAIRGLIDLLIATEEANAGVTPAVEPGSCPQCKAGPDEITNGDTLDGAKLRHCRACGYEWVPA